MATFHKMKVTGPQCAEFITQPLQAMRELNPTLNAVIQSTEQMNKVLCEAAKQPPKKRRKVASSAVAIHDAHLQRVKALKSETEHTYDPLTRSLAQSLGSVPEVTAAPSVVLPPAHAEEEDESSLSSHAIMQRIAELLPPRNRGKVGLLEKFLKPHPSLIRISSAGRPIIGGKEVQGANIVDIMRSLYVWRKGEELPRGASDVIQALQSVGVPSGLLSTTSAIAEYRRLLEKAGEESHPEEEEEEETTPQKFETPAHSAVSPLLPPPPQSKVVEHPSTSGATVHAKAQTGSLTTKESPSPAPKPSAIPTATTKRTVSQSTSQKGQGYRSGHWLGPPLWPGFGQPKTPKPSLPGKPIRWLRLY
jgi:hypothetical protein